MIKSQAVFIWVSKPRASHSNRWTSNLRDFTQRMIFGGWNRILTSFESHKTHFLMKICLNFYIFPLSLVNCVLFRDSHPKYYSLFGTEDDTLMTDTFRSQLLLSPFGFLCRSSRLFHSMDTLKVFHSFHVILSNYEFYIFSLSLSLSPG